MKNTFGTVLTGLALTALTFAPISASAQRGPGRHDQGKHDRNSKPKPPKNRKDNKGWDKDRRHDDRRQQDDRRRFEEDRARQERLRRDMESRREADRRRQRQIYEADIRHQNPNFYRGSSTQREIDRRQQTKNEWRNLAIGAGLVGVLGLLKKDNTLTFAGAAGALYSLYRYEQDRKSQSSLQRGRAYFFSQPYFYRDGHRYDRRTVTKNGQRYYQFIRH